MATELIRVVAGQFTGCIGRICKYSPEGEAVIMFDSGLYGFRGVCLASWQYEIISEKEYFIEKLRGSRTLQA